MKGMVFKFVVEHLDDESKTKEVDEFPVARVQWNDETDRHMMRVGGESMVQRHLKQLYDGVRQGVEPSLEVISKRVVDRFTSAGKKARGGK